MTGDLLSYYAEGAASPACFSTAELLAYRDGRCGSWARFANDCLRIQGISDGQIAGQGILFRLFDWDGKTWRVRKFVIDPTWQGQGLTWPPMYYSDHALLKLPGSVYRDPSYGVGPFASLEDWENATLWKLEAVNIDDPDETLLLNQRIGILDTWELISNP